MLSIHEPSTAIVRMTDSILGIKDKVASCICVVAWKTLTANPTIRLTNSKGADTYITVSNAFWAIVITAS